MAMDLDETPELQVARAVDDAHAAAPDLLLDLVAPADQAQRAPRCEGCAVGSDAGVSGPPGRGVGLGAGSCCCCGMVTRRLASRRQERRELNGTEAPRAHYNTAGARIVSVMSASTASYRRPPPRGRPLDPA